MTTRRIVLLLVGGIAIGASGCRVYPYCLNCADQEGGPVDADVVGDDVPAEDVSQEICVPGIEVCNGVDDDCNGRIDEGLSRTCGGTLGVCTPGTQACVEQTSPQTSGTWGACSGVEPSAERCNGLDDDCDGVVDNGDPGGGVPCGTTIGNCTQGITACTGGMVVCQGGVQPMPETCNGQDDDCDGVPDNGDPGGGAACGMMIGTCTPGTFHCIGGTIQCIGGSGPQVETCDGRDNDCDGVIDNGFDLQTDPFNCGACGVRCNAPNAQSVCQSGICQIAYCLADWWDINGNYADGCEYSCSYAGMEVCNGADDDCNGFVDDNLPPRPPICYTLGECAGSTAICGGTSGWTCNYPSTVSVDAMGNIIPETNCDNLDNDCDGLVDEAFPAKGQPCGDTGVGACQGHGTYVCNATQDGLACNVTMPGIAPSPEVCNGVDDDCNGLVDDGAPDNWVQFSGAFGTRWVYQYEASHPDATATATGFLTNRPCSTANRMPWVNVTYPQAQAACGAIGARLCTEAEWQRACQTAAGTPCTWSYSSACTTYAPMTCNGNDYWTASGGADSVLATGSLSTCYANWGAAGHVFDLSGNAKEWCAARSAGVNPLRGGADNSTRTGISCTYNFVVGDDAFEFGNVGFRCCRDTAP